MIVEAALTCGKGVKCKFPHADSKFPHADSRKCKLPHIDNVQLCMQVAFDLTINTDPARILVLCMKLE